MTHLLNESRLMTFADLCLIILIISREYLHRGLAIASHIDYGDLYPKLVSLNISPIVPVPRPWTPGDIIGGRLSIEL